MVANIHFNHGKGNSLEQEFADTKEKVVPISRELPSFEISNADEDIRIIANKIACCKYGDVLPSFVKKRMDKELELIIQHRYSSVYILMYLLTKFAHNNGYQTISRGSVGSSFVAFLLGITNVNPLPIHYHCNSCGFAELVADGLSLGYNLSKKTCSRCGHILKQDGQDIPYETFMGIDGDRMPQIEIDFPSSFRDEIIKYLFEILNENRVSVVGTVSTVFDFRAKQNYLSNINILGHPLLDVLSLLEKYTGTSPKSIDINDPKIYALFNGSHSIGIDSDEPATAGLPEFDTDFVRNLIKISKPQNFSDLVKISGLSHGVWTEKAEELLLSQVCKLQELPAAQDDIYNYLVEKGVDGKVAFKISETVRNSKFPNSTEHKGGNQEPEIYETLINSGIQQWYIDSLSQMHYPVPKAHIVERVKLSLIFAWYKVYYPLEFYVANLNIFYENEKHPFLTENGNEVIEYLKNMLSEERLEYKEAKKDLSLSLFVECFNRGIEFKRNFTQDCTLEMYSIKDNIIVVNY